MTYNNKILCKGLKGREVHRYDGEKETMKKCVKTWAVAGMAALFVLGSVTAAYAKENITVEDPKGKLKYLTVEAAE